MQRQAFLGAERRAARGRPRSSASRAGITWPSTHAPRRRRAARSVMCASGARSPEAPTEPWPGSQGMMSALSSASSVSTTSRPHARVAARQAADLQHQDQPHHRVGQQRADADGVRQHQVALQRRELLARDAGLGEHAEAGVDAVDRRRPARRSSVDRRAPSAATRASARGVERQRDRAAQYAARSVGSESSSVRRVVRRVASALRSCAPHRCVRPARHRQLQAMLARRTSMAVS